jgi:hypothetical protein
MDPDEYQQAWQAHSSRTRITVDANLLLNEVQRSQQNFRATIFHRDLREAGVGLVMIPVWFYLGAMMSLPWSWYLTVPAFIWVFGFIFVDRMRQQRPSSQAGDPLLQSVQESLAQVEHQIWLLRNVFWWYLLPFTFSLLAFFAHVAWLRSRDWWEALAYLGPSVFVLVLYFLIYRMNQRAVRRHLEPRRQELLALLTSLDDETTGMDDPGQRHPGEGGEFVAKGERRASVERPASLGRMISIMVLLAAITTVASVAAHSVGRAAAGYPKRSPFAAVRWQQSQPEVRIGDEWFKLVSLNDLPAADIVTFSQQTYGNRWRKRFEEDLVELLSRMGHPPQDTVKLVVQSLTTFKTRTLEDVPLTEANRRAIRNAAQARERALQQGMHSGLPSLVGKHDPRAPPLTGKLLDPGDHHPAILRPKRFGQRLVRTDRHSQHHHMVVQITANHGNLTHGQSSRLKVEKPRSKTASVLAFFVD